MHDSKTPETRRAFPAITDAARTEDAPTLRRLRLLPKRPGPVKMEIRNPDDQLPNNAKTGCILPFLSRMRQDSVFTLVVKAYAKIGGVLPMPPANPTRRARGRIPRR